MTLQELEQKRQQHGFSYKQVADLSRLPEELVIRALKHQKFPGYEAMRILEAIFGTRGTPDLIREAKPAYAEETGPYTLDDYFAMPEDRRVELIDGVIYDMTAPFVWHQSIGGYIYYTIYNYIRRKKGKCQVYMAPVDVQLDCDNKTMVQPDVLVLCDTKKNNGRRIMGAPDFLVEVLSHSTRKKDMTIKLRKYKNAGVREYWMVDVKTEKVIVHHFEKSDTTEIYGFDSKVPVGIYNGDLKINFANIRDETRRIRALADDE